MFLHVTISNTLSSFASFRNKFPSLCLDDEFIHSPNLAPKFMHMRLARFPSRIRTFTINADSNTHTYTQRQDRLDAQKVPEARQQVMIAGRQTKDEEEEAERVRENAKEKKEEREATEVRFCGTAFLIE